MTALDEIIQRRARIDAYWQQQPNPLDPAVPVDPAHWLTATPTFEAVWQERAIARAFRHCPTCRAFGTAPCRTRTGNVTRNHRGRG